MVHLRDVEATCEYSALNQLISSAPEKCATLRSHHMRRAAKKLVSTSTITQLGKESVKAAHFPQMLACGFCESFWRDDIIMSLVELGARVPCNIAPQTSESLHKALKLLNCSGEEPK